ncbi:MAG: hypothetical protein HYR96_00765, partial [Deltaproteobacteria bacterium]|nr:hypothetical protein [Deltaproteobacteria bacterium]
RVGARTIFLFEEFGDLEPLVLKTLKKITDRGGFQNPTPLPLARPDEGFHVLNLTTPDDFRRLVQGDGSYERRFPPVHIREPDVDAAFRIVRRTASSDWEEKHGPKIEDAAIRFLIHFRRFLTSPPLAMPDSILSVTEQLFTWKTSHPGDDPKNITIQDAQIFLMRKVGLTDVWFEGPNGEPPFYDLEKRVKQHVIGHDKQVHQICEIIKAWARFETGGKVPIILIGGPKGSGKDTIVRALNLVMFGHDGGHLMKSIAGQKGYGINALIEGPPLGNHDDSETGILIQALETGGPGIIGLNEAFDTASIELDKLKDFLGRSEFHPMGRDTRARPLMWPVFILGQFGEQLFPDSMSDDEMARKYAGLSAAEIEGVFIMGKDSGTVGAVPPALIDRVKETGGMFVFTRSPRSDFAAIINTWLPQRQMDLLDRNRIELLPTQNLIQFIIDKSARERLGPRALSGLTRDYTVRVLSRAVDQLLPVYDASVEVDYKNVDGVDTIIVRWLNAKPNHRTEWTFVANQILSTKTVGTVPANCPEELLNVQSSL